MKAAVIHANGTVEQLVVAEVEAPKAGPGQAVLEVRAAALNHLDIWIRKGRPGAQLRFPHVLGSDAAGVVAEVGEGVDNVAPGDEVILNPGLSCGHCPWCLRGEQSECPQFSIVGVSGWGTFAERVVVPAANLQKKPAHLNWEEAAALSLAHLTAWRMLHHRARLLPGESVLIHGIGGGVAIAALQFAKLAGATAIVTSSSNEKLEQARAMGADHILNYSQEPAVAKQVLEVTGGIGVDVVVDAVGAATFPINLEAARKGGRITHCGVTTGASPEVNLSLIYWKQLSILGSTMGSQDNFRQMVREVQATGLKPVVDKVFPLAQAQAAQQRMEEAKQFGKIVLRP